MNTKARKPDIGKSMIALATMYGASLVCAITLLIV